MSPMLELDDVLGGGGAAMMLEEEEAGGTGWGDGLLTTGVGGGLGTQVLGPYACGVQTTPGDGTSERR